MKILNSNAGLLTNADVAEVLMENLRDRNRAAKATSASSRTQEQAEVVEFESRVREYIGRHVPMPVIERQETADKFARVLRSHGLTALEIVMAMNFPPRSEVEIVESCEKRMSGDDIQRLLTELNAVITEGTE